MVLKLTRMHYRGADILRPMTGGVAALTHRLQAVAPPVSVPQGQITRDCEDQDFIVLPMQHGFYCAGREREDHSSFPPGGAGQNPAGRGKAFLLWIISGDDHECCVEQG